MNDARKSKAELIAELTKLRHIAAAQAEAVPDQLKMNMAESEEIYRVLLESATNGVILTDARGRIELVNKQAEEIFLYSRQELLGQNVEILIPPQLRILHKKYRKEYSGNPTPKEMGKGRRLMGLRKDGREVLLEIGLSFVKTPKGVLVMSLIDDVTQRKQAEDALKKSHEQLRNLSSYLQSVREDERKRMAREIHDELGQALTALDMDVTWLSKNLMQKQQYNLLEKTRAMSKLIRNTLEGVQQLSAKLRPTVLDDLGLMQAIHWQIKEFQERTGIQVLLISEPENIEFQGELNTALFRIIQESLTNIARHANAATITLRMSKDEHKFLMVIQDDGKGITTQQVYDSKSLGLIGMQERLHPWKGTVEIKGIRDSGTNVTVTIPLKRQIKLLIADDHPIVREGLKQIVTETEDIVLVDEAGDGFEVISKIWKNDYDVLLLDISMPGKGGFEVLEELKSLKPELPVLILSIHAEKQYALRALKAGASGYLTKSGIQKDLIKAIRKVSQGMLYVPPDMAEELVLDAITSPAKALHESLSNREFQVMCMIASGNPINEIAKALSLGKSTVSTMRARMLAKMKMKNNAEVTYYAIKEGLVK